MIARLIIWLVGALFVLWLAGWLLEHLGLIFVAALGFGTWGWWRSRHRA